MRFSAINSSNVEGFSQVLLPGVYDAIRRGEPIGALGLVDDDCSVPAAAGAIAGMAEDGVFRILSLYIEEKYRSHGFGQMLLDSYTAETERFGLPQAIRFLSSSEDHILLERFLEKNDFEKPEASDCIVRFRPSDIEDDKEDETEAAKHYTAFSGLSEKTLLEGNEAARLNDLPLPEGGLLSDGIIRECSIGLEKDASLEAYAVVEELSENELLLSAVWCRYPVVQLKTLFSRTIRAINTEYPSDPYIYAFVPDDITGNLLGRSLSAAEIVSRYYYRSVPASPMN